MTPDREQWLHNNPQALKSVLEGLSQAKDRDFVEPDKSFSPGDVVWRWSYDWKNCKIKTSRHKITTTDGEWHVLGIGSPGEDLEDFGMGEYHTHELFTTEEQAIQDALQAAQEDLSDSIERSIKLCDIISNLKE